MNNTYYSPITSIINKINCLTSEEIIEDIDWQTIYSSPTLLYELIKKGKFYHFDKLPPYVFSDVSIATMLMNYANPPVELISKKLFEQQYFIYTVLDNHYSYIQYIPYDCLTHEMLIWYCYNHGKNSNAIEFLPQQLITKQCAQILASKHKYHFKSLPDIFKNNIDVYQCVNKMYRPEVFQYAGIDIRKNPFLVSEILQQDASLYQYIDNSLKNSNFFLRQLKNIPNLLEYATDDIKNNEHCVWESVKLSPGSLVFASERLLNTPSYALQLSQGMDNNSFSKSFVAWGEEVLSHKATILELLPQICDSELVYSISADLRNEPDLMLKFIEKDSYWFKAISPPLSCDPNFFITCYNLIVEQDKYTGAKHKRAYALFEYIQPECFNEPSYVIALYDNFKDIFCQVVYAAISHFQTTLIKELKEAHENSNDHLIHYMEKLKLHYALEKSLKEHDVNDHELIKI